MSFLNRLWLGLWLSLSGLGNFVSRNLRHLGDLLGHHLGLGWATMPLGILWLGLGIVLVIVLLMVS